MGTEIDNPILLIEDAYPLTPLQAGMLFHNLSGKAPGVDITQLSCHLQEPLDVPAFERAWQTIVARHPVLRTAFRWEQLELPQQEVHRSVWVHVQQKDWRALPDSEQAARLEEVARYERQRTFEVTAPPLLRLLLIRLGEARYQLLWTMHHLLLDARSFVILFNELFALYQAYQQGEDLALPAPKPFKEFVEWLQRQDWAPAQAFWGEKLRGFTTPTPLTVAAQQELKTDQIYGEQTLLLPESLTSGLKALVQAGDCTVNTILQGAWALLLSRYAGEQDVLFGAVRAGRRATIQGADSIAGLFINTVPLRIAVPPQATVTDWLREIRKTWVEIRAFEHTPLVIAQAASNVPPGVPLFESILNVQDPSWEEVLRKQGGPWKNREFSIHNQPSYPLGIDAYVGEALVLKITYDQRRFAKAVIERMLGHLANILAGMAENPGKTVAEIPWLSAGEKQQLLTEWNNTQAEFPTEKCIHQLFAEQLERTPEALAVTDAEQQLTYRQLDDKANRLARYLETLGIGPESLVGILLERSADLVISELGILKAGGAFVPLDPAYPRERLAFMIEDTRMPVLITAKKLGALLPENMAVRVLYIDEPGPASQPGPQGVAPAKAAATPNNLAYVIYTSGSTGKPKGVPIEHRGLVNLATWHQRTYSLTPSARATLFASPAFDASVWEIWPALTAGASLHIAPPEVRLSPPELVKWLVEKQITISFLPTPLAEAILDEPWPKETALRVLLTGGDKLHRFPKPNLPFALHNLYGPTENTVVTTGTQVSPEAEGATMPSIGRPIANTQVYILDARLEPVPIGVPGELHVSGVGLARGYLNRPELVAEKFIPNPFDRRSQIRLYKTGDRAYYRPDGQIEFLGRVDQQVKVRGFRIEPGEIEAVLQQHPAVRETAVLARAAHNGDNRLIGYVVKTPSASLSQEELCQFLKQKLPEYMVPSAWVWLETLPLTANGKINRQALPEPGLQPDSSSAFVGPRTPTEEVLAGIYGQLLHLDRISIYSSFFALGGHSLLATQAASRIQTAFQTELPVQEIFDSPSVAELARKIDSKRQAVSGANSPPLAARPLAAEPVLSYAQERLWFLEQLEPGQPWQNVPAALRIEGPLDVRALEDSLSEIVRRHASFRTTFSSVRGQPKATIAPAQPVRIPILDLSIFPEPQRQAEAQKRLTEEARRPFDLGLSPLLRSLLLRLGPEEHLLSLTTHHIVSDGWSMSIFYRELRELYQAFSKGLASPLAPLPLEYSDYATWQRQWLKGEVLEKQMAYWKQRLAGKLPVLNLPTDHPRPAMQTLRGATHFFQLSPELTSRLKDFSRQEGVTLYMVLLAGFQALLHRYSGQEDILVGSPIAGRTRAEFEDLLGLFLNTLVFRAFPAKEKPFRKMLAEIKKTALEGYAHQDLPFEKLVEALQVERDLSRPPVFQVMFVLQNTPQPTLELPGLKFTPQHVDSGTAKFDLTLVLEEGPNTLQGYLEFNTDLFDLSTVAHLPGHMETLLAAVVANPDLPLGKLPMLTEPERRQLLLDWNRTETEVPKDKCLHHLIEAQAERTPEAIALVFEDEQLTYAELNRRANQLAHQLRRMGLGPEMLAGICVERSLEMVLGILAILKAGAAYVPLDPTYPKDRLKFMVEDAQVAVLVTQEKLAPDFGLPEDQVLCLDRFDWPWGDPATEQNLDSGVSPDNLAYVIYTSGSTGKPKGVMIAHRNVVNFFAGMDGVLGPEPGVWLAVTSICFDISVLELWWTLSRGFKVVIQSDQKGLRSREPRRKTRQIDFSLFYFASQARPGASDSYQLLLDGAKLGDQSGFTAIWTPERHFHPFGGLYPNPSVTGAALAVLTEKIQIRAGSVVMPLHHPIRVAEEWAVVDNLSKGRVGLSFASGWHGQDFVFAPNSYAVRKELMLEGINTVRRLWRGESVSVTDHTGKNVEVKIFPPPLQRDLPIWITSSGNPDTFQVAGEKGFNLLTHLSGQSLDLLARKIRLYRESWKKNHHPGEGQVTLMLHTFVWDEASYVWEKVRQPFADYLRAYRDLSQDGKQSLPLGAQPEERQREVKAAVRRITGGTDEFINDAVERYLKSSGLFGTRAMCLETIQKLKAIGVDEVACLIDFGLEPELVLSGLRHLANLREESQKKPASAIADYSIPAQIERHQVTHFQCTPSLLSMLLQEPKAPEAFLRLKKLLLGGEALPPALLEQVKISGTVHNMYGPTETTVWSTSCPVVQAGSSIPIGRPIANTDIYILDEQLQPVPRGVLGELYIGGAGVTRGYLNRPELTAQRFVPNPFKSHPGARLYRTGDLARYLPEGNIEFLGRVDHQVKVRGFRIELGEIEAALRQREEVRECVVVLREFGPDDKRLVGYLVARPPSEPKPLELRRFLQGILPDYMVPSAFVLLEKLPLTPNGKIDRKALPEPEKMRAAAEEFPLVTQTDLEKKIAAIWEELLHVQRIGANDNFFDLGGHSLLVVQLQAMLKEKLSVEVPVVKLFQYPTISTLAQHLREEQPEAIALPKIQERARRQRAIFAPRPILTETRA